MNAEPRSDPPGPERGPPASRAAVAHCQLLLKVVRAVLSGGSGYRMAGGLRAKWDYAATDAPPTALGRPYAPACGRDGGMRHEKGRTGTTETAGVCRERRRMDSTGRMAFFFIDVGQIGE